MWGIIPAAGTGSRIQPLAFSKELLPVGSRSEDDIERPLRSQRVPGRAHDAGRRDKICFVISPGKSDILAVLRRGLWHGARSPTWCNQMRRGLCDAIFRALPLIAPDEPVLVGLPDTVWFPKTRSRYCRTTSSRSCCFPVEQPDLFDAVVLRWRAGARDPGETARTLPRTGSGAPSRCRAAYSRSARSVAARGRSPTSTWARWSTPISRKAAAHAACKAGDAYVDVGTVHGYREAIALLNDADRST